MEGDGWVIFFGVVVFFGALFVYLMFMIFLPEWVGITGPTALRAEASHRADPEPDERSMEVAGQAVDPSGSLVDGEMVAMDVEAQSAAGAVINPAGSLSSSNQKA